MENHKIESTRKRAHSSYSNATSDSQVDRIACILRNFNGNERRE